MAGATIPLRERRGVEPVEGGWGGSADFCLVRTPVERLGQALLDSGLAWRVDRGVLGRTLPADGGTSFLIQFEGHDWTLVYGSQGGSTFPREVSALLGVPVIHYGHEDASGTDFYSLFDSGRHVEEFTDGPDYSDEFEGAMEEMGEEAANIDFEALKAQGKFGGTYFRSERREVDVATITDSRDFIDAAFREQGAYFPHLDFLEYVDGGSYRIKPEVLKPQDVRGVDYATWDRDRVSWKRGG